MPLKYLKNQRSLNLYSSVGTEEQLVDHIIKRYDDIIISALHK